MKVMILDNDKKIFESTHYYDIVTNMIHYMYLVSVLKDKRYKVKYKYNYNDLQTFSFIEKYDELNTREIRFVDIPTKQGYIQTHELLDNMERF